jgi:hypothetical protein
MAETLKNDAELLTFPTKHDNSVVVVLANWCGHCVQFKKNQWDGVENAFHVAGIPIGLAQSEDLSPELLKNRSVLPGYYPSISFYGQRGEVNERYQGERSPSALLAWTKQQIKNYEQKQ